jgi:hypothetical protein
MAFTQNQDESLTSEQLIKSGLDDQVSAIAGYENIIWKLRAGYVLVLNGALALVLGGNKTLDICNQANDYSFSISLFSMILGISLTFFVIDFGYVRKKIKFVVARELLIDLACSPDFNAESENIKKCLKDILHIAGETRPKKLPDLAKPEYKEKRRWNLFWILLPIYAAIPLLSIFLYLLCHLQSHH